MFHPLKQWYTKCHPIHSPKMAFYKMPLRANENDLFCFKLTLKKENVAWPVDF